MVRNRQTYGGGCPPKLKILYWEQISICLNKCLLMVVFSKTKVSIIKCSEMFNQPAAFINFYISILILGLARFSSSTKRS